MKCEHCNTDRDETQHHLITKEWRKKLHILRCGRMWLCRRHHTQVHHLATNKELSLIFNTREKVLALLKGNKNIVMAEHELRKVEVENVVKQEDNKKVRRGGMNHKEYALF